MLICYMDETGDDGFPVYSSDLFVLTSIYMPAQRWRENYNLIYNYRKEMKERYGLPVKMEFHCNQFIKNKKPYRQYNFSSEIRRDILFRLFDLISNMKIKIINTVIDKNNINKSSAYPVLENALKYSIQRLENDCRSIEKRSKLPNKLQYIIITDEGRVPKMTKVSRKIQRINYIPSQYSHSSYQSPISRLIEDPLPKNSNQSYFVQVSDAISYIIFLYVKKHLCTAENCWSNRISKSGVISEGDEIVLMDKILNRLNIFASSTNKYGVVYYPK